jgi:hypothetical protein
MQADSVRDALIDVSPNNSSPARRLMKASFEVLLSSFTAIAIAGPALAQSSTAPALQYAEQG